jgi:hypothetical protein
MNNITVDGSYFNNSFGLGGQPGDRAGVAPISLEAVEQVQVNVAPYDVRQGNFVGAGINMVTRSGTNRVVGSFYSRYRNNSMVGTQAGDFAYNPGTFTTKVNGGFLGGPIVRNRLFAFGSFEKQEDERPITTLRANRGEPVGGSITRVLASDLDQLSAFMSSKFNYNTGAYEDISSLTPAKPLMLKFDYNLGKSNKINFRYSQLDSSADKILSGSNSAGGIGRGSNSGNNFLGFASSNYSQLENIKSGIGEWNSVIGSNMSNNLIIGYTKNNESRGFPELFPFVDILAPDGSVYTSLGTDPFTFNNELYYQTFQLQDSYTKFSNRHTLTFGGSAEKYHSDNVFFQLSNSVYVYNSLNDFYADANAYTAGRTTSPVALRRFQVAYMNLPGYDKPLQQLDAWYVGGYIQDQWQMRSNLTLTAGLRVDAPIFDDSTTFPNPVANALTFRDENGNPVQYDTGQLPGANPLWSPRAGFNWDVKGDQKTQVRGGTGVFTGKPAYVWLSNQIGNTGLLTGLIDDTNPGVNRPFNPNPQAYWPAVSGASAASYALNVTDPDFKFPQTWRTNAAIDQQLPWGIIATGEYLYNRDVNGIYYINANLPAPQGAFTGIDTRPRWIAGGSAPTCSAAGNVGGCVTRINSAPGNIVTANYVIKNQNVGRSWSLSGSLMKTLTHGLSLRGAYSYGESRNTVDAGSTASSSFGGIAISGNPNNSPLTYTGNTPGHRVFANLSYTKQYFGFGGTTISAYWEAKTNSNNFSTVGSYIFAGDMNGDSVSNNDLIYIPRDTSEMRFVPIPATATAPAFSVDQQVAAFEAYIQQDPYLNSHRGQYAERNAAFLPIVKRMDLGISQDIFGNAKGARHLGQIRLDITNFGNLLSSGWGVGRRFNISSTSSSYNLIPVLTNPVVDASGAVTYRMAVVNNALPTTSYATTAFSSDVYVMMVSFRYNFN